MAKPRSTNGWLITPHVGAGPVRFGMTRDEVRRALGSKGVAWGDTEKYKLGQDTVEVGYTHDTGTRANADERCELVVVRGGASLGGPELAGRGFLQRPYDRALAWMRERDPSVFLSEERVWRRGARSDELGVAMFCAGVSPMIDEVMVFAPNYFTALHPGRWCLAGQAYGPPDVPDYDVQQHPPIDEAIAEEWGREIRDPELPLRVRGVHRDDVHPVSATKLRESVDWRWEVAVAAMEHVQDVPLEGELRERIAAALRSVPGITEVRENDREVWGVRGDAHGAELVAAVARVVDGLASEIRAHLQMRHAWSS